MAAVAKAPRAVPDQVFRKGCPRLPCGHPPPPLTGGTAAAILVSRAGKESAPLPQASLGYVQRSARYSCATPRGCQIAPRLSGGRPFSLPPPQDREPLYQSHFAKPSPHPHSQDGPVGRRLPPRTPRRTQPTFARARKRRAAAPGV